MADYIDQFLQAMDLITNERIKNAGYDKTIVCTIIDNKNASTDGIYIVSDGSSKFEAHYDDPEDILHEGQAVNVLVPQNNYNNIKTILGKVITDTSESFIYVSPLDKFFDMTGNVLSGVKDSSLLANGPVSRELLTCPSEELTSIDLSGINLKGYTRMAIQGDFRSYIPTAVSGNYGLYLELVTQIVDATTGNITRHEPRHYVFDSSDMWGNPYNFASWFNQSLVFDISNFDPDEQITCATMYFYQGKNFLVDNNEKLPYYLNDNENELLLDNLFVKDISVSFGYSTNDSENIFIYTNNGLNYNPENTEDNNRKTVLLRWNHIIDYSSKESVAINSNELVDKFVRTDDNQIDIEWFQFEYGFKDDQGIGKNWKKVKENSFSYTFDPDITKNKEYIKALIKITDVTGLQAASDDYNEKINRKKSEIADTQLNIDVKTAQYNDMITWPDYLVYQDQIDKLNADINDLKNSLIILQKEFDRIKLTEAEYVTTLTSDILIFTNDVEMATPEEYAAVNGLQLECTNQSNGIFRLYDTLTNDLITPSLQYHNYNIKLSFNMLNENKNKPEGISAVYWYIPYDGTMIQTPLNGENYNEASGKEYFRVETTDDGNRYYVIERHTPILKYTDYTNEDTESLHCELNQTFRIKPHLLQNCGNNRIKCSIIKNNITYSSYIDLEFGNSGTNGTNNTLILSFGNWKDEENELHEIIRVFDSRVEAWTEGITTEFDLSAKLYNANDEEQDLSNSTIKWEFLYNQGNYTLFDNKLMNPTDTNGCILKCTVYYKVDSSYEWTTQYTGYLIVPWRAHLGIINFVGADRVIYDSSGTVSNYYKDTYKLNGSVVNSAMIIYTPKNGSTFNQHVPTIKEFKLHPKKLFFNDRFSENDYNIVAQLNNGEWRQPILIIQNNWGASIINDWDGTLQIDEENGTILSTMVGAGQKDANNKFEGVLMGNVRKGAADTAAGIGLYGYRDGVQSYGFNVDGTAFIGKSGKTQLNFDGNKGIIKNTGYDSNYGMKLNFDDDGTDNSSAYIDIISGKAQFKAMAFSPYLTIKDANNKTIMSVENIGAKIGGWNLTDTQLSNSDNSTILHSDGTITCNTLYANNKGTIGGWKIKSDALYSKSETIFLYSNSNGSATINDIALDNLVIAANNNFGVTSDGKMYATSGKIGKFTLTNGSLQGGGVNLYWNKIQIGSNLLLESKNAVNSADSTSGSALIYLTADKEGYLSGVATTSGDDYNGSIIRLHGKNQIYIDSEESVVLSGKNVTRLTGSNNIYVGSIHTSGERNVYIGGGHDNVYINNTLIREYVVSLIKSAKITGSKTVVLGGTVEGEDFSISIN